MAINLASKYSDQIAEVFTRSSFIKTAASAATAPSPRCRTSCRS